LSEYASTLAALFNSRYGTNIRLQNVVVDGPQAALNMPCFVHPPVLFSADIKQCYDVIPTVRNHPHGMYNRILVMISLLTKQLFHKSMAHLSNSGIL
jgi:hypothetical protein